MIQLKINDVGVAINQVSFSDGAKSFTLMGALPVKPEKASLMVKPEGSLPEMFFEIAQAVNVLRSLNNRIYIELFMPYIPYARQDRPMVRNAAFSLEVFADLLNSLNIDRVVGVDAHSDVSRLIKRLTIIQQHQILNLTWLQRWLATGYVLVSPDAGSLKKIDKVAEVLPSVGRVTMGKSRDVTNGNISVSRIIDCDLSSIEGHKCLIVDDICDGGATFIAAAKVLKQAGAKHVDLWVTHGIFSRGVDHLLGNGVDKIFTTSSYYVPNHRQQNIHAVSIEDILSIAR